MDGGALWAAVHGVTKSWTRLSDFTFTFHFHALEKEMATTPVFLPGESQGRGAWWAAVYGVAQSRTRLKRLSSSSSSSTAIPPLGGAVLPGEASLLESPIHSSLTWPQSPGDTSVYSFLQRGTPKSHLPVYSSRQSS